MRLIECMRTVKETDRRAVGDRHDPASIPPYRPRCDPLRVRLRRARRQGRGGPCRQYDPFHESMTVGFFPATTMPDADWWQALWPDPAKVLIEMGVTPGMVVVDLCCGDGLFTAELARIADRVYAIDIDSAILDRAMALA